MNNVANINDVSNSVKATPSILHCGTPVITTGIMAKLYGTDEANVKMNFSRNADRFIEGKHYFKLEGVELKGFKDRVTESYPVKFHDQIVGKRARSLTLWTERGAARHAKMLDTDQAWDVFEALEDFYFTKKQEPQHKSTVQERNPLKNAVNLLVSKKGIMYPEAYSLVHQQFNVGGIDELTADQIPMAVEYVHKLVMEGEYIPKQDELPMPKFNKHKTIHTLEGAVIHIRAMKEYWNNGLKDSLKQLGYQHTGSMTEHMTDILFHLDWAIHEIKGDNLDKLPA
ncbi:ORF6N domain-containing protein [Providencia heimbachae]|uniref:ORF6N domain-containing protein n=1 Tax=Providencia heimbachae TaxID=333962 RepID=UPI000838F039